MAEKVCSSCNELKLLEEFYKESRVKDGRARRCKLCHTKVTNEYRKKNPDIYRKASSKYYNNLDNSKRHSNWIKRYGLSPEEYKTMLQDQKSSCKICLQTCSSGQLLSVDHCHKTGKVRGLLCKKCNAALGMLDDNVKYLESAINYLKSCEGSP